MRTTPILIALLGLLTLLTACQMEEPATISSFEECVEAGNPVMESHPRQCRAGETTFTEQIDPLPGSMDPPLESPSFHACTEQEKQADACTLDYNPVCGLVDNGIRCVTAPCPSQDAVTFGNGCGACAAQASGYYPGACEDQGFVVCGGETKTGFSPEQFAEDIGGICVELCPANFDPYMTQIGVEMCIMHYGEEEIEAWPTCTRSSASCECVKATETTRGEPVEDAEYRCVPEQYGERMLFRSGMDRLDENGEQSVMIA